MEISCVTSLVDAKSYSVTQCYILSGYPTPSATSAQSQCHCRIRLPLHQFGCWPLRRALCGDGTVWYGGPSIWWYSVAWWLSNDNHHHGTQRHHYWRCYLPRLTGISAKILSNHILCICVLECDEYTISKWHHICCRSLGVRLLIW